MIVIVYYSYKLALEQAKGLFAQEGEAVLGDALEGKMDKTKEIQIYQHKFTSNCFSAM